MSIHRIFAAFCLSVLLVTAVTLAADRPNVIVILTDDMGYSDLGCMGSEIATPNLDGLARSGVILTQFYNTARCSPTRASLLTGLYPHQAGMGHLAGTNPHDRARDLPGYPNELSKSAVTIAEVLRAAGYGTYMVGKWHLTWNNKDPDGDISNWPLQRGFDRYYGIIPGASDMWDPQGEGRTALLVRGNKPVDIHNDPDYKPAGTYYMTDAFADNASTYIEQHVSQRPNDPFFVYVAFNAAHWPVQAPEDVIEKYLPDYQDGFEPVRQARYRKAQSLGVVDAGWELSPPEGKWPNSPQVQQWEARNMAAYAADVEMMDRGVGTIVETLRRTNQLDNTLIVYLQDNGGCAETWNRDRISAIINQDLPADEELRKIEAAGGLQPAGGPDSKNAYGQWANVSNTPFRKYKHWVNEGGISTPLIAHWPAGFEGHGELRSEPTHLIDVMATVLDITGADYPKEHDGNAVLPPEGRSLVPVFRGEKLDRDHIFFEHEGNRALRQGKWKIVSEGPTAAWQLYDIDADRSELNDLAERDPQRVRQMAALWDAEAKRTLAIPWPWTGDESAEKEKHFEFARVGEALGNPLLRGRALRVHATVDRLADGVIVAQGGGTDGFAIYVMDGELRFAVRHKGKLTEIASATDKIVKTPVEIIATLDNEGEMTLTASGAVVATGSAPGTLNQPIDRLDVGSDTHGQVGRYKDAMPFQGKIERVTLDLE